LIDALRKTLIDLETLAYYDSLLGKLKKIQNFMRKKIKQRGVKRQFLLELLENQINPMI